MAVSDQSAAMEQPEGGSTLPGINAVRLAIVGGLIIAVFAAFAPEVLIGLAVAYPAGLAFAAYLIARALHSTPTQPSSARE